MTLAKKPTKPQGNPYKVLYWMGAGVLVLFAGILALVLLQPKRAPRVAPDPERTLLWLYDSSNPGSAANATVIEESRSDGTLVAVAFVAPDEALQAFGPQKSSRKVQEFLATQLDRKLHHRVFLPYSVVATLIDAADGITVDGQAMRGADAVAYITAGDQQSASRATAVMLALSDQVYYYGLNMGVREGLSLARQVDTDFDLMSIPDVLGRWSGYDNPSVQAPATSDPAALQALLTPDPVEESP